MSGNIDQRVQVRMVDFQFDQSSFGGVQVQVQGIFFSLSRLL